MPVVPIPMSAPATVRTPSAIASATSTLTAPTRPISSSGTASKLDLSVLA